MLLVLSPLRRRLVEALAFAASSADALLCETLPRRFPYRFAVNDSPCSMFVHVIAARQAWERPKPGRTICGWDYVAHGARVFLDIPPDFKRCGKCASVSAWHTLAEPPSDSD